MKARNVAGKTFATADRTGSDATRFAVVFGLAILVRFALIGLTHSYRHVEYSEIVRVGWALAQRGSFADAFGPNTGPTAHVALLYPLFVGAIFKAFGNGVAGSLVLELFSCTLVSISYGLLVFFPAVLPEFPPAAALAGGLLGALLPINRWVQAKGTFEYGMSALLFTAFALVLLAAWRKRAFSPGRGAWAGLWGGLLLLGAPQFLPLLAVLALVPFVLWREARGTRYIAFVAVQFLVIALCLAPWTYRNWRVLGSPVWARSNAGMELWLSNQDGVSPIWEVNDARGLFANEHPSNSAPELAHEMAVGEVAYNHEKMQAARQWIAAHPGEFARLSAERAILFWFPRLTRGVQTLSLALITVLGFAGLALWGRVREPAWWFFVVSWGLMWLASIPFQQSGRMRYPIEWGTFLFAGYALDYFLGPRRLVGEPKPLR